MDSESLLRKFSNDESHPFEVRKISLMIFDDLDKNFDFSKKERKYLETAALLHDIGYHISSEGHNKNSYKMIVENGIDGFDEDDCKIIGLICRYHRGKMPDKKKHVGYKDLEKKDRKKVKRLAGILRIADGLDRAHMHLIQKIKVNFDEENSIAEFSLHSTTPDYKPDISFAIKKRDLFEKAYKCQTVFKFD